VLGGFGWALATPVGGNLIHAHGIPALWLAMFAVAILASAGLLFLDRLELRSAAQKTRSIST
jgi:hypothetical protein